MTPCPKFLFVGLCLLLHICTQSEGFLSESGQTAFASLFQPWISAALQMEMEAKSESHELPEVKRLTTASYKGINYVMVENVSLGFAQAERYCQNEFTDPMQLASVQSEDEWHMLTTVFGTSYPSEMWLGGTVRRSHANTFVLHWLDSVPFSYHRFQPAERHRWMSNWRVTSHGCIVGNSQSNALGNWSAELTPCTEPRPFVCKEVVKQSSSVMQFSPNSLQYDWRSLWNSLQFPSTVRSFRRQNNNGFRKPGHFRFQTIPETKPGSTAPAPGNIESQSATEVPRSVETHTTPMLTNSTEVPSVTSASPSSVAPRSTVDTAAMATGSNPSNPSSTTASPQTTPQAPIVVSEANDAELKRAPKFTFFRTAPRALVESTDRTDVHLPQSNPTAVKPSSGTTAQAIAPPPPPSTVWQMTSYVDELN